MTAKFDPVAFCNSWLRGRTSFYDLDMLRALAAEAAKQQARKDAEICRGRTRMPYVHPIASQAQENCAQAIEREAGL